MKTMTRILCLALVLVTAIGLFACGKKEPMAKDVEVNVDEAQYNTDSKAIYNAVLGDFYTAYEEAKKADNVSKKFALMAVAEAKLMESAVMLPTSTRGGTYAISRVAPYTVTPCLWGNDSDRFHDALVCTNPLKTEDRDALKALWAAKKGTGTYLAEAKAYLTGKGYTIKDNYTIGYNSDPKTWDAVATSRAADSEAIVNTYDGLFEYNVENVLTPALATSYEVSGDGLTYTFHIREGVKWVDSQGTVLKTATGEDAVVTADDFVAGMQHMMDAQGGLEYLIQGVIVNANEYIAGSVTDFSKVGVKATDTYTLVYTLEAPCTYFMTMLGYNVFAPVCRSFYTSKGGKFGTEYDSSAADYVYGKTPDAIAYCGPYIVTNNTAKTKIVFSSNENYWNKDNINVKTITWLFNDGTDSMKSYNDMKAGTIDGSGLSAAQLTQAKTDKVEGTDKSWFDTYSYVSLTDATSYMAFYNLNRIAFTNTTDGSVPSTETVKQAEATKEAMNNVHFRRAISYAVDRAAYNAQTTGEDVKLFSLRNSYTPGTFVSLDEEVTIKINGTDKVYPAGTFYGKIMQDQIDADGVKMKVWDANADGGIGSGDGFDGWYNVANAKAELELAIADLAKKDIVVDKDNPIIIELPYPSNREVYTNKATAYKQSIEAALEGKVIVNLTECVNDDQWYDTGYYTDYGYQANYDVYDLSGWGPDYGDPSTYLDTFLPDGAGYMIKCIGIF